MPEKLIKASLSKTVSDAEEEHDYKDKIILVGSDGRHKFRTLLFFDISSIPVNSIINSASLLLFRAKSFFGLNARKIKIHALLDYFSLITTYDSVPEYEAFFIEQNIDPTKAAYEIDIKDIVLRWINGTLQNKGIIMFLDEDRRSLMAFCSAKFPLDYLRPLIRISYQAPEIPTIIVSNQVIKFVENETVLIGVDEAISEFFDISYLLDHTIIAINEGNIDVNIITEISNDSINWIEDTKLPLGVGQNLVIIPKYYAKYIRFKTQGSGNIKVRIRYVYKEFMH